MSVDTIICAFSFKLIQVDHEIHYSHYSHYSHRLGNAAIELALAMGAARVVGLGRNQARLESWKKELGNSKAARVEVVALTGDVDKDTELIKAATPRGAGAEVFMDLSPPAATATATDLLKSAIRSLKVAGRLILMGGVGPEVTLPYGEILLRDIQVYGKYMYDRDAPKTVIRFVESGLLSLEGYNHKVYKGLDKMEEALNEAEKSTTSRYSILVNP